MKRTLLAGFALIACSTTAVRAAAELRAGVARVEITDREAGPVNDPLYAKALVLEQDGTKVALITLDVVAIGEIGRLPNSFLGRVRDRLKTEAGLAPENIIITASHCHGIPRLDTDQLVIKAVKDAAKGLVAVKAGAGSGNEDRISENRRLRMKDGSEVDMRRAYSLPKDDAVAAVGPMDPQIGLLRLDRLDGQPFALLYQFACHPIMNPPSKGNSADYPGYASKAVEESLGGGVMAFFVQGCAGDINPIRYKEVSRPADAEPLGNKLGLSVLRASRELTTKENPVLKIHREILPLPRRADYEARMAAIQAEQTKLLQSLKPTNINFKTFLPLLLQQRLWPDYPSHSAQAYLHDATTGTKALNQLDADNRASVEAYLQNLDTMEKLTRLNTNLALLKKHLEQTKAAGSPTIDTEVVGLRIGDFKLVTFPGELTVQVGLAIKKAVGDPHAFVSGYTNGYIYYTPTTEQALNSGYAQEDCDTLVAPAWQTTFRERAVAILRGL